MITIETSRFGAVNVEEQKVLNFVSPILGFNEEKRYVLLDHAEDSPFKWLQSVDNGDLAFVVTNPKLFGVDYEFALPDHAVEKLKLEKAEDVMIFTIVNIPESNPSKMTTNLLAPIVIHQQTLEGMQVVLDNPKFSTRQRLLPDMEAEEQAGSAVGSGEEGKGD